ncbi:hypothetical protein C1T31_03115 [Hanstruepera neustonica]|uniref:Secretion system C-terminal sorting domain-containing protein n=1 Tax=Hanstruepera neustonica TaxID=1445657 RepID=A0A2K1E4F1_9FLAO|nr:T9SS type A sorting domain-containing protein [Hanstruepera neustonica]PNQ75140.1 hypothetical protein C1T31_03115 [Hanstruepera neustonica]
MNNLYVLAFCLFAVGVFAQTTIQYPQRVANYDAIFFDSGGHFDNGADELGMWANGGGAKQSVAWKTFTENGLTGGTPSIMAIGDSFTITVAATQAFGQIGIALLSSPTSTLSWDDRQNNYAVQVNLNGNGGAFDPWEVVSNGGTVNTSSINGSADYNDFKFEFTLNTETTMIVSINDGTEEFNITLNNTNITGYAIYFADDWNGFSNADIFWKPSTQYTYAMTLGLEDNLNFKTTRLFPNPTTNHFSVNSNVKSVEIFDTTGKLVKAFQGSYIAGHTFETSGLKQGIYFIKATNNSGSHFTTKLMKI